MLRVIGIVICFLITFEITFFKVYWDLFVTIDFLIIHFQVLISTVLLSFLVKAYISKYKSLITYFILMILTIVFWNALLGFSIYAVVNFALMLQVEELFNNSQVFMMDWVPDFITPMIVIIVIYVSQTIGWVSRKA